VAGYLLDTNVISELVRPAPRKGVIDWIASEAPHDLHLSSVTLGELVRGTTRLPDGRRREALRRWVLDDLRRQFEGRILPFDHEAAVIWGTIMGEGDRRGHPRSAADVQIAAIAIRFDLMLATRNTADFKGVPVRLLDPRSRG
jgi:predicted nucleic acid-binding protein